jgi:hypothetical protein
MIQYNQCILLVISTTILLLGCAHYLWCGHLYSVLFLFFCIVLLYCASVLCLFLCLCCFFFLTSFMSGCLYNRFWGPTKRYDMYVRMYVCMYVCTAPWKLLGWSWRLTYLAKLLTRLHILWFLLAGLHPGVDASREIAHGRCTLIACVMNSAFCHMQHSWKRL